MAKITPTKQISVKSAPKNMTSVLQPKNGKVVSLDSIRTLNVLKYAATVKKTTKSF